MTNKNLKAIVLAGGYDQIELIKELKKRGYYIVLIDYHFNPPAKDYADLHYQDSTLDIDVVREIAINEKVDLVTTACTDQALLTVAKVCEELGIPCYLSYEKALNVTNKVYMKNKMVKSDIPTAKHIVISDINEVNIRGVNYPVVVKPCDCNSSKGVKKNYTIKDAISSIKDALSLSRSKEVIVEEFIEGFEISVDAFITDSKAELLLITESEKIKNTNGFTITQSKYPIDISDYDIAKIKYIVQSICESFNLLNGPLLVQMLVSNDGVFVIEFSARMGGGTKYKLIQALTGFDIMKAYVDLITGIQPKVYLNNQFKFAHLNYCYVSEGIFHKLVGFEELKKEKIIYDYFKYKKEGTQINKAETSSDRVAGYLVTADSFEELSEKEKIANNTLKILTSDGKDIMRHDIVCS